MLSLLRMHWIVNRRLVLQVTPLFTLWLFLGFRTLNREVPQEGFFASICLMMAATLMAIVTLQGITHGVEAFLLSLPLQRRSLVSSAYLAALLAGLMGLTLPLLVVACVPGLAVPEGTGGTLVLLFALLATGLFLLLPLRCFLGGEKGLTTFALLLGLTLLVAHLMLGLGEAFTLLGELGQRVRERPMALGLPLGLGWLGLGLLSWWGACLGLARRHF